MALGRLQPWRYAAPRCEPWGDGAGGACGTGRLSTTYTLQPVCCHPLTAQKHFGDRNGLVAREERAGEHTGNQHWQQGQPQHPGTGPWQRSGRTGEAGWIKSLSFTWAGVQPQNSSPKARSHEGKKIARRRIIHTSSSYVGTAQRPMSR